MPQSVLSLMLIAAVVFVFLTLLYLWYLFNRLVRLKYRVENGYSQIAVQLTRRHDLVPNLASCVKGYMKHEQETLREVIEARNLARQAVDASTPDNPESVASAARMETGFSASLGRLLVVMENYPELKADASVARLMEELASTENRITFARQSYNDLVTDFNYLQDSFPALLVSRRFGFSRATVFQLAVETRERIESPPGVSLGS